MGGEVKVPLGHMENHGLLPHYGFFNDAFRESMKRLFIEDRGDDGRAKNGLCGSCVDFIVPARFAHADQSINYVECHDNATYFDHVSKCRPDYPLETKLQVVEAATYGVLFSLGVPFLHMGQEIGLSKFGEENSYNKGDHFNQFDYSLLDERYDMAMRVAKAIALRRQLRPLHIFDPRVIGPAVNIDEINECVHCYFVEPNIIAPRKTLDLFINVSSFEKPITLPEGSKVLFGGDIPIRRKEGGGSEACLPPHSVALFETR